MGRLAAQGVIEQAAVWGLDPDAALHWHLTCNHFPPIEGGVPFARLAIEAVREGRGDDAIDDGVSRRAPNAWDVVEAWHLHPWLEDESDEVDWEPEEEDDPE